jgi:hypothetical protein
VDEISAQAATDPVPGTSGSILAGLLSKWTNRISGLPGWRHVDAGATRSGATLPKAAARLAAESNTLGLNTVSLADIPHTECSDYRRW